MQIYLGGVVAAILGVFEELPLKPLSSLLLQVGHGLGIKLLLIFHGRIFIFCFRLVYRLLRETKTLRRSLKHLISVLLEHG